MNILPSISNANFDKKYIKQNNALNCTFLNIRSLKKNFNEFQVGINRIADDLDLIMFVETNISDYENNLFQINGFHAEFKNRPNKRGGGIAVFINQKVAYSIKSMDFESFEIMALTITKHSIETTMLIIYRPPRLTNCTAFLKELNKLINTFRNTANLMVVGDINIDLFKRNAESSKYLDVISTNGLMNCNYSYPTRCDIKKGTKQSKRKNCSN